MTPLRYAITGLPFAALLVLAAGAKANPAVVVTEHARVELVAHAPNGVRPGEPVWFGLAIEHAPHWHTYWRNPGDSGLPTTLAWQLPAGMTAHDIDWPTPKALPIGPLTNYGYDGSLLLPVPVSVDSDPTGPTVTVRLRADWLICEEICIPESGEFELAVPTGEPVVAHAAAFADALARRPVAPESVSGTATVEADALVVSVAELPTALRGAPLQFFAEIGGVIDHAAPIHQSWVDASWQARVPLSAQRSESPTTLFAVLTAEGEPAGIRVALPIVWPTATAGAPPADLQETAATLPAQPVAAVWWLSIGLALLGGALLNLMPCVFPVLALKLVGFAQGQPSRRSLLAGGLAYTAGVVVAFVALAGLLLALRAGGEQLGWGFQLQSPFFVAALAALFTLIGLNLAGVFAVGALLPSRWAAAQARHPLLDHALTGVLAVAIASPCTAPFMGVAVGAALTGPPALAIAIFVALGLGMALPYLLVSAWPGLASRLPRSGMWMLHFRQAMAFPMFVTVVWLMWVLGQQVGNDGAMGVLLVLVALGFAAWAWGTPGFGRRVRAGLRTVALGLLVAAGLWVWPALQAPAPTTTVATAWSPWSEAAVAEALAGGRPVFVDFTAAWCITCQVNKRAVLSDPAVLAAFDRHDVRLLRADWTRRDPAITQALNALGRSGVPVYALYVPGAPTPQILPTLLRTDNLQRTLAALPTASAIDPTASPLPRSSR